MYINRRRLKKKAKGNRWFRLMRIIGIEVGLSLLFLSFLFLVFHKQSKSLLSPLVRVRETIASALGVSDSTPDIEKLLGEYRLQYTSVKAASDSAYLITLSDDSDVLVTTRRDLHTQINSLQVILNQLTMEGKRFDRLDLRFEKPVIHIK